MVLVNGQLQERLTFDFLTAPITSPYLDLSHYFFFLNGGGFGLLFGFGFSAGAPGFVVGLNGFIFFAITSPFVSNTSYTPRRTMRNDVQLR